MTAKFVTKHTPRYAKGGQFKDMPRSEGGYDKQDYFSLWVAEKAMQ